MSREIRSDSDFSGEADAPAEGSVDEYKDRLLKYIPAEIVTLYVTLSGVVQGTAEGFPKDVVHWAVFLLLLVATPIYLSVVTKVKKRQQLAISTVAFLVWVFALGGPGADPIPFQETYGAILLPTYTFLIPLIQARR